MRLEADAGAGKAGRKPPWSSPKALSAADMSISDFRLQNCERKEFCGCQAPAPRLSVTAATGH